VADRIVDAFDLVRVYDADYRFQARKALAERSRISLGRRDGLIAIEVDDTIPQRAADIANRYVDELRRLTKELALTEVQQRRAFLEQQLALTRERLMQAQVALQSSGFSPGALKADARAAAERYARVGAEVADAEIRLQGLRLRLADSTPEVQTSITTLQSLRAQLATLEKGTGSYDAGSDYVSRFREFKYQETLLDLFARQYEIARLDEAREGALVQVVDVASSAEWKTKPKRAVIAVSATLISALLAAVSVVVWYVVRARGGVTVGARLRAMRGP
jgi:capsule polysaccharide export protein KpsE/RkpR